jgi:hypothetical protein
MTEGDVETFHEDDLWRNRIEGGHTLPGSYFTREMAVNAGCAEALDRRVDHVVRSMDGTVSERHSYDDPRVVAG